MQRMIGGRYFEIKNAGEQKQRNKRRKIAKDKRIIKV